MDHNSWFCLIYLSRYDVTVRRSLLKKWQTLGLGAWTASESEYESREWFVTPTSILISRDDSLMPGVGGRLTCLRWVISLARSSKHTFNRGPGTSAQNNNKGRFSVPVIIDHPSLVWETGVLWVCEQSSNYLRQKAMSSLDMYGIKQRKRAEGGSTGTSSMSQVENGLWVSLRYISTI